MAVSDPAEMRQLSQLDLMGHLFRRAGFGATRDELEAALAQGYEATLEEILIVADWGNERVQILRSDGAHLATLLGDATLSKWAREFIEARPDVAAKRQSAADLEADKRFWGAVSVRVDGTGRLYVVEHSRHRMQIYECV